MFGLEEKKGWAGRWWVGWVVEWSRYWGGVSVLVCEGVVCVGEGEGVLL